MWSEQNRERLVQQIDYEVLVNLQFFFSKKMDCQPLFLLDLDDLGLEDSLKLAFVGFVFFSDIRLLRAATINRSILIDR